MRIYNLTQFSQLGTVLLPNNLIFIPAHASPETGKRRRRLNPGPKVPKIFKPLCTQFAPRLGTEVINLNSSYQRSSWSGLLITRTTLIERSISHPSRIRATMSMQVALEGLFDAEPLPSLAKIFQKDNVEDYNHFFLLGYVVLNVRLNSFCSRRDLKQISH